MIQVIYTPNVCVYQKKHSKMLLKNIKTDKYERCCTFDGPDYFSVSGSIFKEKIKTKKLIFLIQFYYILE